MRQRRVDVKHFLGYWSPPLRIIFYRADSAGALGELEQKYQLMVKAEDQIDTDAVPLYEKAIKSIPKDFNQEQIREWVKLPASGSDDSSNS